MTLQRFAVGGVNYVMSNCITCGVAYTVPAEQWDKQRRDGGEHWCSNGHKQGWYPGQNTENDNLRRRAERAEQQQARLMQEKAEERERRQKVERRLAATQGVVTKIKTRTRNGVCPCCNRQFVDLHRHMNSKHPDYGKKEDAA